MRTTLPTYATSEVGALPERDSAHMRRRRRGMAGPSSRMAVEQRPQGGLILRVRPGWPPAQVVGHLALLVLVLTFLLVAASVITIFSVSFFEQHFDIADAWDNLPRL